MKMTKGAWIALAVVVLAIAAVAVMGPDWTMD